MVKTEKRSSFVFPLFSGGIRRSNDETTFYDQNKLSSAVPHVMMNNLLFQPKKNKNGVEGGCFFYT
jgi:hypothetical protein